MGRTDPCVDAMSTSVTRHTLPNGHSLSRLVCGAWRWADAAQGSAQDHLRRIETCLDQGISSFDHADIYGDYRCETLFGQALALRPALANHIEVVSKTDIVLVSPGAPGKRIKHYDTRPEHVRASVQRSLQRLGVPVLNLILLHRPDPLMDADTLGPALDALVDDGLVLGVGVSNFMPWDMDLLQSRMRHRLQTNQIECSLGHTSALHDGQLAHAQHHRHPVMAWSPLAGGQLLQHPRLWPALEALGQAQGVTASAVAVAWLLQHPAHILPVMGSTDLGRMAQWAQAQQVHLDRPTWFELLELANGHEVP
jgi:predicted oxidoreductase